MANFPIVIVFLSAFLHALWNCYVKAHGNQNLNSYLVVFGSGFFAIIGLAFDAHINADCFPYLFVGVLLQATYFILIGKSYEKIPMSVAYPLMRGIAPLIVVFFSLFFLNEHLNFALIIAICFIVTAIACFLIDGLLQTKNTSFKWSGVYYAILNGIVIALIIIIDGTGSRKSGAPFVYVMYLNVFVAMIFIGFAAFKLSTKSKQYLLHNKKIFFVGGLGNLLSYSLALWAITQLPIAVVATFRESSIVFAIILSVLFLKEKLFLFRLMGIISMIVGIILIKWGV